MRKLESKQIDMILYKFLNADKSASASYVTYAFYDVNEEKSLKQFYVTELREVSPEIVQAGINIRVGMYNEVDFMNMAKIFGLALEKWSDNIFLGEIVSVPTSVTMTVSSPTGNVVKGADLKFAWTAIANAKFYEIFCYRQGHPIDFRKPTLSTTGVTITVENTFEPGVVEFFILAYLEDSVQKSQVLTFNSTVA